MKLPTVGSYSREVAVAVAALMVLAAVSYWSPWPPTELSLSLSIRIALVALAALASVHAPLGAGSLGLGAAALPLAIAWLGPTGTGWLAACAYLLRRLIILLLPANRFPERSSWRLTSTLEAAARLGLAGLLAGWAGRGMAAGDGDLGGLALLGGLSGLAWVVALVGLGWMSHGSVAALLWRSAARPLGLDVGAWAFGLVLVGVVQRLGWLPALLLLTVLAVMSLEAARNAGLRQLALGQLNLLREVTRAGHRIIFRRPDLRGIAEQIHLECRRMVPFSWFRFELLEGESPAATWAAGPDGKVGDAEIEVPEHPPPLPGIHRRSGWRVVDRELVTEDRVLGRLRLWCDPRRLDSGSLDLLDTLLPQMASAVHRALLDREARHDPLTGLPDRRSLERQLGRTFADCLEEGTPMAIVMCDLDHFKRINDRIGHAAGDQALIEVARLMEDHRRETDLCCRYGGEEFAVVLERTDGETALRVAERLRQAVEGLRFMVKNRKVPLRISAGVASFPALTVRTPGDLLKLADDALYEAKRSGRNCCLLNVGGNRFMDIDGAYTDDDDPQQKLQPPTLFA